MTKEQLKADNERLGAEVAAWRELATVLADAKLPRPAPGQSDIYERQSEGRLKDITALARGLMNYAGASNFPDVILATTDTLRSITGGRLWYRAAEGAMPAPVIIDSARTCQAKHPDTGDWCVIEGPHTAHRDGYGETWNPCCVHCIPDCGRRGHVDPCGKGCQSVQQLVRAS